MQKKFWLSYFFIFFVLMALMSLSKPLTERIRGNASALSSPLWSSLIRFKESISHPFSSETKFEHPHGVSLSLQEELQHLVLKNQLLENELSYLNQILYEKKNLDHQLEGLEKPIEEASDESAHYQKYLHRLRESVRLKIQAVPARVISRSLDTWNRTLWINVGEADNQLYGTQLIAKYSPVLVGDALVGIVDQVEQHQSRVLLITDPSLTPSVRVARGGEQDGLIADHVDFLLNTLKQKTTIPLPESDQNVLFHLLTTLKSSIYPDKKSWYLAKGELEGCKHPSRRQDPCLKGTGFNYDITDEAGEGRDLRTGKLLSHPSSTPVPILKLNDILVTTGLDGVFPPGLKVAIVTKIDLLKEGDYYYELEAKPVVGNLDELSVVFVIPPVE